MLDVVTVGEVLVDMVSVDYVDDVAQAGAFEPHFGGSPANLANNLRHLGVRAGLVATLGDDAMGGFLRKHLETVGLPTDLVATAERTPSTLILVSKSRTDPKYEVYRGADMQLSWGQLERALAQQPRILHTTCFGLSGLPARSHILRAGRAFAKTGGTLSIDANYAEKVWPDRQRAQKVVREWIGQGALVKVSELDWHRLFGETLMLDNCERLASRWLELGARLVCCTFGGDGAAVVSAEGTVRLTPKPVDIVDATGAGDSFWSGFLAAHLDGRDNETCLRVATEVAAVKLRQQGPLRAPLAWRDL